MIIANGTVELKTKTGGGIDPGTGFPTPAVAVVWGDPVPCQYTATRYSLTEKTRQGREPYTAASYTILVEDDERSFGDAAQLRLRDRAGKTVGEYSIIRSEPLEAVGQIRIYV